MKLSLSHLYPGSGVVLQCINSWSLPYFLLRTDQNQWQYKTLIKNVMLKTTSYFGCHLFLSIETAVCSMCYVAAIKFFAHRYVKSSFWMSLLFPFRLCNYISDQLSFCFMSLDICCWHTRPSIYTWQHSDWMSGIGNFKRDSLQHQL